MPKNYRRLQVLRIINDFWLKYNKAPSSQEVADAIGTSVNNFCGIRRRLERDKLLETLDATGMVLTEIAKEQLQKAGIKVYGVQEVSRPITNKPPIPKPKPRSDAGKQIKPELASVTLDPIDIPILGEVKAGPADPEDLVVDLSPRGENLLVPDIMKGMEVFALEVVGNSMLEEHIKPGDFVIVEKVRFDQIKFGEDLLVVKYLDKKYNDADEETVTLAKENLDYKGPTLKYLYQIPDKKMYLLSRRKKKEKYGYKIETRDIDQSDISRVVEIHRVLRRE